MNINDVAVSISTMTGKDDVWQDGSLTVTLGDGTQIYLEYIEDRDEFYMYVHVASIPEERFGRYAMYLLKANHLGRGTGGSAVLAYDADSCNVVLWDRMNLGSISQEEFAERFSYIYLAKLYWANMLQQELADDGISTRRDFPLRF